MTDYSFAQNLLWAHGRRNLFVVELDFEAKEDKSMFTSRSGIYEKHRAMVIQPEILIKRGYFDKERNITQALEKNNGIPEPRSKS